MTNQSGVFRKWTKRYAFEYGIALAIYVLATAICVPRALSASKPETRAVLLAMPSLGVVLMTIAAVRHVLRIDEFLRRKITEGFAVAAAFTGIWTLAYGFFELAGFPRLSVWWVWPGMAFAMLVWSLGKKFFDR